MRSAFNVIALSSASVSSAPALPNILFYMADDTGWNNVEWHNKEGEDSGMHTPHAHALLKEGIELDRHYTFPVCSPTRSSFMSGRYPYRVQQYNLKNCDLAQGVPRNMTTIPQKLKLASTPYATVHIGKWHLGMASAGLTPSGRGFDKSLTYFEGAQDHFTQRTCVDFACLSPINDTTVYPPDPSKPSPYDFWLDDGTAAGAGSLGVGVPAKHLVETAFNGYLFNDFAVQAVKYHNLSTPLFMYLAPASAHSPLEAPQRFIDMYPEDWYVDRRLYAAECSVWDEILGNVTAAMKTRPGMWDNTLLVFSSDNGGPVYWSMADWFGGGGANNWPLKGGKASPWEGGVRAAAFVSGGLIPPAQRGTKLEDKIHIADWYSTFSRLAGVDPTDQKAAAAGLPPIDSLDMWPLLSGATATGPRSVVPISINVSSVGPTSYSALISDNWKLVVGRLIPMSFHQGPQFPNASNIPYGQITNKSNLQECVFLGPLGGGCLYNLATDPNELENVAKENLDIVKKMHAMIEDMAKHAYGVPSDESQAGACNAMVAANGNFFGPWLP